MARKRETSPWTEQPGWLERDIGAVLAFLRTAFEAGRTSVQSDEALPDGRLVGEVAARACGAVRAGRVPDTQGLAADVAVTLGTILDNGWVEFRPGDGTERFGTLDEVANSVVPNSPPPAP